MKKMFSLILALTLCLNLALPALAEEPLVEQVQQISEGTEAGSTTVENTDEDDDEVTGTEAISIIIYDLLQETTPTETPTNLVSAGVTPDSPLYFLDKLIENIQLALAKTPEAKAALLTAISQERLAEIEGLDSAKLDQYLDTLISDFTTALEKAADAIAEAQEKGVKVTKLMETLKQAAELGSSVELPESIRKTERLEEAQSRLKETTKAIKVQAAVVKGIDEEVVIELRSQGLGYGQIALLNKLAATIQAGTEANGLEQVMAVFAANKSIGQTMKALGTNPGQVKKQNQAQKSVQGSDEAEEQDADDAVEAAEATKAPANSGKVKENTPAKGKGK